MHRRTQRCMPFLFGVVIVLIGFGVAWGDDVLAQRGQPIGTPARESRAAGAEPPSGTRPHPSLLGTTGYFDLPTSESLSQGNFAIGLFPTFEKVFTADISADDDFTRLRLDRYSAILGGAYGIRDNLELGIAIRGAHTDAEVKQFIAGDISSGDEHETGFGKIRVGLKYRPAALGFPSMRTLGFAGLALEPFVDIQTHGSERGLSYPQRMHSAARFRYASAFPPPRLRHH